MKPCRLTISTTIDGTENKISRSGKWLAENNGIRLCYREENALVGLLYENGMLTVERHGDYVMRLCLREGHTLSGELGVGGSSGEIFVETKKLQSRAEENSWLLLAEYTLWIGGEAQCTKFRLYVKTS